MFITLILRKFLAILSAVIILIIDVGGAHPMHEVKDADNIRLNFTVLSDCHVESNNYETMDMFNCILKDTKNVEGGNDVTVFLGDNTMNGQEIESMVFYGLVDAIKPSDEVIVAVGNHDLSNGEGDYTTHFNRFADYNEMFFGRKLDTLYYYDIIEGCYFIVLATESATVNEMDISDEQIAWLNDVLAQAKESGMPAFVFNHYPVFHMDYEKSDALVKALQSYDNLIYFCGHTHAEYSRNTVYEYLGVTCINLPKATEHGYDWYDGGIGAQVEVYENEVVVRIRDFYDDVWHEEFVYEY